VSALGGRADQSLGLLHPYRGESATDIAIRYSENGQVVRHASTAARDDARLRRPGPYFCDRAAPFPRRLYATPSREADVEAVVAGTSFLLSEEGGAHPA
jgi:hypothetical protein